MQKSIKTETKFGELESWRARVNWLSGPEKTEPYNSNEESQNSTDLLFKVSKCSEWVAADKSGNDSEAKNRTNWKSKKWLENGMPLWKTTGSF